MRLALGFCGHFANATLSALSITKLEVRHHSAVRNLVVGRQVDVFSL